MTTAVAESNKTQQKRLYIPSIEIRRFVSALFLDEVAGRPYRAEKLTGIPRHKYYTLLENPEFVKWFDEQRMKYRKAQAPIVDKALMNAVEMCEVPAMRLFYELEGSVKNSNGKNSNGNNVANLVSVVIQLDPTVATEEDARRIANGIEVHPDS
jgi:hypothetical protein